MQANMSDEQFKAMCDEIKVDWYYDFTDDHKEWLKLSAEYQSAMKQLRHLSDADWEKFVMTRVPDVVREKVRTEMEKIQGKYSDDFRYKQLKDIK